MLVIAGAGDRLGDMEDGTTPGIILLGIIRHGVLVGDGVVFMPDGVALGIIPGMARLGAGVIITVATMVAIMVVTTDIIMAIIIVLLIVIIIRVVRMVEAEVQGQAQVQAVPDVLLLCEPAQAVVHLLL